MAQIKKLQIDDETLYPVTIPHAVVDPDSNKTTREELDGKVDKTQNDILKEPTGFVDPESIVVTGDGTTRKITLSGTVAAYWRGALVDFLIDGYLSPAHGTDTTKLYYLSYNGTSVSWYENVWTFDQLQIAIAKYDNTNARWYYFRECHGLMDWRTHEELHRTIGTYKVSGGVLSGVTLSSTTAAQRRPDISETHIADEDLHTTLPALTTKAYTQLKLTASEEVVYALDAVDIVPLLSNNPYYNQFTTDWVQTLMPVNSVQTIWIYAMPVGADANSQKYRYLFVQGQWITQATNSSAGAITAAVNAELLRLPSELNLNGLLDTEIIAIGRAVIAYTGGNWSIRNMSILSGNKYSQIGSPSGNFLSGVTTDDTMTGNGTLSNPLSALPILESTRSQSTTKAPTSKLVDDNITALKTFAVTKYSFATFTNANGWRLQIAAGNLHFGNDTTVRNCTATDIEIPSSNYANIFGNINTGEIIAETSNTKLKDINYVFLGRCYPFYDLWDLRFQYNINGKPANITIPSSYSVPGINTNGYMTQKAVTDYAAKPSLVSKPEWVVFSNSSGSWRLQIIAGGLAMSLNGTNRNNTATDILIPTGSFVNIFGNFTTGEIVAEASSSKFTDTNQILIGRCWPANNIWDIRCAHSINGKPYNLTIPAAYDINSDVSLSVNTPSVSNTLIFVDDLQTPIYKKSLFKGLQSDVLFDVAIETTLADGTFKRYDIGNPTNLKASDFGTSAKIVFNTAVSEKRVIYKNLNKIHKNASAGKPSTLKLMTIGDSLTQGNASVNVSPMAIIKDKFATLGITVTPCGTFNQDAGAGVRSDIISEGRGFWNYKSFVGKDSSPYGQPITISTGTGLTGKFENPFLRLADATDKANHPDWCFSNAVANPTDTDGVSYATDPNQPSGKYYIFDFAYYLTQHSVTVPDVITIALGINDWMESSTIINLNDEVLCAQILYQQIRAALPSVKIMWIPNNGMMPAKQTDWENEMFPLQEKLLTYFEGQQTTDSNFFVCPIFQHVSRFNAYLTESSVSNINSNSNVKIAYNSDVHVLDKETSRKEYMAIFEAGLYGLF